LKDVVFVQSVKMIESGLETVLGFQLISS